MLYVKQQWLFEQNIGVCDCELLKSAVESGNLKLVKWIQANRPEQGSDLIVGAAITRGHLELTKWLISNTLGNMNRDFICGAL